MDVACEKKVLATRWRCPQEMRRWARLTLKLLLSDLWVATSAVEVVADATGGAEAEDEGHSRLGHGGCC